MWPTNCRRQEEIGRCIRKEYWLPHSWTVLRAPIDRPGLKDSLFISTSGRLMWFINACLRDWRGRSHLVRPHPHLIVAVVTANCGKVHLHCACKYFLEVSNAGQWELLMEETRLCHVLLSFLHSFIGSKEATVFICKHTCPCKFYFSLSLSLSLSLSICLPLST